MVSVLTIALVQNVKTLFENKARYCNSWCLLRKVFILLRLLYVKN